MKTCGECGNGVYAKGLCRKHYKNAYDNANRDALRAQKKEYYSRAEVQARVSQWEERNKKKRSEQALNRVKVFRTDASKVKTLAHRRRTRLAGTGGDCTPAEWEALLDACGHRCRHCAKPGPLTLDHIVPVARGGCSSVWNLQPLCSSCNSRKRTKDDVNGAHLRHPTLKVS